MTVMDPVEALLRRRHEEWKSIVRRRHRFRPWKARRIIARRERLREMSMEWLAAFEERDRMTERPDVAAMGSGECGAQ